MTAIIRQAGLLAAPRARRSVAPAAAGGRVLPGARGVSTPVVLYPSTRIPYIRYMYMYRTAVATLRYSPYHYHRYSCLYYMYY